MMTIDEIRRENLAILIAEFGGSNALAIKIEKSDSQVSQWLNASIDSKTKRPRGISDDMCRLIEGRCGKPRGWMDNRSAAISNPAAVSPDHLVNLINLFSQLGEFERTTLLEFAAGLPKGAVGDGVSTATQNNA